MNLMTRDEFRAAVLSRDLNSCVICHGTDIQLSVHHIVERRLFIELEEFGGYFLDNGATLCEDHHIQAENTTLSCEDIRTATGITEVVLPAHLSDAERIDKWGNPVLDNGCRLRGELFYDEPVQKMLAHAGVLDLFDTRVKYPRTRHFTWSRQKDNDDVMLWDLSAMEKEEVVVSEKVDGESSNLYRNTLHTRSISPMTGEDRSRIKALH